MRHYPRTFSYREQSVHYIGYLLTTNSFWLDEHDRNDDATKRKEKKETDDAR